MSREESKLRKMVAERKNEPDRERKREREREREMAS